jgi:hypothetical protein
MTLLLMFYVLSISVMGAEGQVTTESSSAPIQQVKDSSLAGVALAPANEEFTVWMPDSPQLVGAEQLIVDQRPLTMNYYGLIQGGTEYAVLSVSGLEDKRGDLAHMLMLNLYSKLIPNSSLDESEKSEVAIKANYQRDISLNGYLGREFTIQAHNRTGLWRFYSVGRKFYAVAVSTTRRDNILINRFLDSFMLGSPTSAIARIEPVQPQPNESAEGTLPARSSSTIIKKDPVQSQPNISAQTKLPARPTSTDIPKKPVQSQPKISAQRKPAARPSSTDTTKKPVQSQPSISAHETLPARPSSPDIQKPVQSQPPARPSSTDIQKAPVHSQPNIRAQGTIARPAPTETWFVILSTFSKAERAQANQRLLFFQTLGYDAHLVDTDDYPNLKKGFLAVAMGPHSKRAALGFLNKVRSAAPDSYVKPGW